MTWEVLKHPTHSSSSSPMSIIKWVSVEQPHIILKQSAQIHEAPPQIDYRQQKLATDIFFLHEQLTQHARSWISEITSYILCL
jgi:hypothetical protein